MKIRIQLHGALRAADPSGRIELELPADSRISTVREKLGEYLRAHPAGVTPELVARSAFASEEEILHDERSLPADGELSVLPPVSGG